MSAGDRPHLPLATEPMPFLRASAVGHPVPGPVQPVPHQLALEEEPAIRVHLAAPVTDGPAGPPAPSPAPAAPDRGSLPATGASLPLPVALGAIGLAWVLRQRRQAGQVFQPTTSSSG